MRFGSLDLGGGHCFARANGAQFLVKLRPDGVLSAFAESREQTDRVRAVLAPHDDQRRAIFIVWVRGDAHHRPRIRQIEQRLIKCDSIFSRLCGGGSLLRARSGYAKPNKAESQGGSEDVFTRWKMNSRQ